MDGRGGGTVFDQADVARAYYARTPYAPALMARLLTLQPGRGRALDIGCGPGRVVIRLADCFGEVVAVDPSAAMISVAKAAAGGRSNLRWVNEKAEALEDGPPFDLVTAGCSIHFTDHAVLFPKLARWGGLLAVLDDAPLFPDPPPPCGAKAWLDFLTTWLVKTGRPAPQWVARLGEPPPLPAPAEARPTHPHEAWMDVIGRERFAAVYSQSVEDFVVGEHARATWNRAAMGAPAVRAFDEALAALMRPYARDGMLEIPCVSELTWGRPRASPRG